jgi:RNA-directed DNA polymerase
VKQGRKRKKLLGLVFNQKPNIPRREYQRLRAITYNCLAYGFDTQALRAGYESQGPFAAWLRGKINYVKFINPGHGEKLHDVFNQAIALHMPEVEGVI